MATVVRKDARRMRQVVRCPSGLAPGVSLCFFSCQDACCLCRFHRHYYTLGEHYNAVTSLHSGPADAR